MIDVSKLPSIDFDDKESLPSCVAVYFALDINNQILYVGKAWHLRDRWRYHHRTHILQKLECKRIAWIESDRRRYAELESEMIYLFNPPLNGKVIGKKQKRQFRTPKSVTDAEIEQICRKFSKHYNV